jgi:hypothetical protein
MADEYWQVKRHEKEIDTLIIRNAEQERIRVAVIDNGLDVLHPEILRNVAWKRNNKGEIVAGFDPLGKTNIANASFINPELYAFGAQEVREGKIVGYKEAPLDFLAQIQSDFAELLAQELKKPNLRNSFFAHLNEKNYSFLRAMELVTVFDSSPEKIIELHEKIKAKARLIHPGLSAIELREIHLKYIEALRHTTGAEWNEIFTGNLRSTKFQEYFNAKNVANFESGIEFVKAVKRVVKKIDSKHSVFAAAKNFNLFHASMSKSPREMEKWHKEWKYSFSSTLEEALSFKLHGPQVELPRISLTRKVYKSIVRMKYLSEKNPSFPIKVTQEDLDKYLEKLVKFSLDIQKAEHANPSDITERTAAAELDKLIHETKQVMKYLKEQGGLSVTFEMTEDEQKRLKELKAQARFNQHPMLSDKSLTKSHGTHVSGIILEGNKDRVLIEPVRPLTESMDITYKKAMEIAEQTETELREFLKNPVILRGLPNKLRQYGYNVPDGESPKVLVEETIKLLRKHLAEEAKRSPLDFLFINDIVESIKHVGEQRIPIANVSLGTEFNKAAENSESSDKSKQLYKFLGFEFFKYKVADAILKYAPHTTFFIAAGNSQMWVDGHSKSALPFDLTSTYFKHFETKNEVLPNHKQKNIIGVMSASEYKILSSFTNVAIHKGVPVVVAVGEDVLSTVRTTDQSFNDKIFNSRKAKEHLSIGLGIDGEKKAKERLVEFFGPTKAKRILRFKDALGPMDLGFWMNTSTFLFDIPLGNLQGLLPQDLKQRFPMARDRYNGTSMATPRTVQAIIPFLEQKAKQLGVPLGELYGHKDFSTKAILADMSKWTEPLAKDVYLIPLNFVKGQREMKSNLQERALKSELDRVLGKEKKHSVWSEKGPSCKTVF